MEVNRSEFGLPGDGISETSDRARVLSWASDQRMVSWVNSRHFRARGG